MFDEGHVQSVADQTVKGNAPLQEVEKLMAALDEHSIVAVTDSRGRITYANDKFCAISRFSRDELLGQDHRIINSGYHSKEFMRDLWTTITQGKVWKGEIRNRAKDGEYYWVQTTIVPFLDNDSKPVQYVSIRTDITELKNAQNQIQKFNQELAKRVRERTAELEASNQELEAFSYSVSHDLRAPVRHISGYIGLLRQAVGSSFSADASKCVETIADSAKQMTNLIDDLLLFSRMGRAEMKLAEVDLDVLVHETIETFRVETKHRNIVWKKRALPKVNGDPSMLRQVLVNLLSNAVKYTRPRNPAEIEIGCCAQTDSETTVFVRDNGVGFEMKYVGKLFNVFQRLHTNDDFEGTGIGLANVRRIVTRHGGRAWAEGKLDHGATFYFSMPRNG